MSRRAMKRKGKRFGTRYQAEIPDLLPTMERNRDADDDRMSLLLWKPKEELEDQKIEKYVAFAWTEYGLPEEQALALLFYHRHNVQKAKEALRTYTYTERPQGLSIDEKAVFEKGVAFHGTNLCKIQKMMPDKPMASLILYYYSEWKTNYMHSDNMEWAQENMRFSLITSKEFKRIQSSMPDCAVSLMPSTGGMDNICIAYHDTVENGRRWYLFSLKFIEGKIEYWALDSTLEWTPPVGLQVTDKDLKDLMLRSAQPSLKCETVDRVTRKVRNFKRQIQREKQQMELLQSQLPDNGLNIDCRNVNC